MFKKLFSFNGRISRTEYIISAIATLLCFGLLTDYMDNSGKELVVLVYIPLLWFIWAQGAKRCHDMGTSGFYQIIPFYVILMLGTDSVVGENQYDSTPQVNKDDTKLPEEKPDDNLILERISNIVGLGGMTVNERLYESDLDREFYYCKTHDKERAKQILRWLRVDEVSIEKIVN